MGQMRKVVFAALIASLLGGFVWLVLRSGPSEPICQGRPLQQWLDVVSAENSGGREAPKQAKEAMKRVGTNALPTLIRMMRAKDDPFELKLADCANKLFRTKFKPTPAAKLHHLAIYGFYLLGSVAKPAVPQLVKRLSEKRLSDNDLNDVVFALAFIGPDGVPALLTLLTNTNYKVRGTAVGCLGYIGYTQSRQEFTPEESALFDREIKMIVPTMIKLLQDPSDEVRSQAAAALAEVGSQEAETVVPALIATLQDPANSTGRFFSMTSAAKALGRFREKSKAAVPALLLVAQQSSEPAIQSVATEALRSIDPEAAAKAGVK